MSRTLLEQAWIKLDVAVIEMLEGDYDEEEKARLKGVCRGMAEVLALFMKPHFETGDQISAEAARRYKAAKSGVADYETPGLGSRRFEGAQSINGEKPRVSAVQKAASNLTEKERNSIRTGMASGVFKPDELARMYGVSAEVISYVAGAVPSR